MNFNTWFDGISVILLFQKYRSPFLDYLFSTLSHIGDEGFIFLAVTFVYWCVDKKFGIRLAVLCFCSLFLNSVLKDYSQTPRPFDPSYSHYGIWNLISEIGFSFPCGHTQLITTFWIYWGLEFRRVWSYVLGTTFIIAVATSRIYLGIQFPQDVIGGALIAAAYVFLFHAIVEIYNAIRGEIVASIGIMISILFPLIIVLLFYNDTVLVIFATLSGFLFGYYLDKLYVGYEPNSVVVVRLIEYAIGITFVFGAWGVIHYFRSNDVMVYLGYFGLGVGITFLIPSMFILTNIKHSRNYRGVVRRKL